ncbi:MAG: hypothetical protein L3J91_00655, partial [Thermoplasmata archaeon]|nr:hypothetical protein [Thermoplasmata archaeon]
RESRIEMQYLVAEAGKPVRHYREVHLNALVEPKTMLATIRSAGLRASILRTGRFKDRGLYIGRRPTEAYDSPHSRDIARREHPSPGSDRPRV